MLARLSGLALALFLSPCGAFAQNAAPDETQIAAERKQYATSVHAALLKKGGRLGDLGIPSGTHKISFTIAENGEVQDIKLIDDTGNKKANERLLNFVLRAAPFPPPPGGAPISFVLPLRYEYQPPIDARPKDIMVPERR